ncbi:MAG: 4-alpha-glucanotransferase [Planctomycetaceae bacterium]
MLTGRASGLLLHPTSLPNSYGIGDLGPGARDFLHWLAAAKQRVWQVLPLGPTDHGDSPYQSPSAFAGNPSLISLDWLATDGLLDAAELRQAERAPSASPHRVDFDAVRRQKNPLLETAARRLLDSRGHLTADYEQFCRDESLWLESYVAFMSLRAANSGKAWCDWSNHVDEHQQRLTEPDPDLESHQQLHRALQFLFFRQWGQLRKTAHELGILLVGDVPIYVSYDCADVWSHRQYFQLNGGGRSTFVAGVPPDYFSATGQLWNNPLYDWGALRQDGYRWWIERMQASLRSVDMVRLDHFRGFEAYWSIPFGEKTAERGEWILGPGADFLQSLTASLAPSKTASTVVAGLPVIAEDLGMITEPVHQLRKQFDLPGMNVLQFILPGEPHSPPDLQSFEPNSVVYTGTHDNDTTRGWFRTEIAPHPDRLERLKRWTSGDESRICREMLELAWRSASHWAIAPVQDILELGSEARMNTPGTSGEGFTNWQWRLGDGQLTEETAHRLADLTVSADRAR